MSNPPGTNQTAQSLHVEFEPDAVFVFRSFHEITVIAKRTSKGWYADAWQGTEHVFSNRYNHKQALSAIRDALTMMANIRDKNSHA